MSQPLILARDLRARLDSTSAGAQSSAGFELRVAELRVDAAKPTACIGPSGSGKTTLLRLLSGELVPDQGQLKVLGVDLTRTSTKERRALRRAKVGLVFQELELLEYLSASDNILLPHYVGQRSTHSKRKLLERVHQLAERAGIQDLLQRKPERLSQGERQRVAICRALIHEPQLILCDEPTGNLDPETSRRIVELLLEEAQRLSAGLFLVTHDHSLLTSFDSVIDMAAWTAPRQGSSSGVSGKESH